MGLNRDSTLWRLGDIGQPRTDDILLSDSDTADGAGFRHRRIASEAIYAPAEGYGRVLGGGSNSGMSELVKPVSYMGIWAGVHAWQE